MTAALEGGEWSAARLAILYPWERPRYPLYRRLDGPQGRSGRAENLAPSGFDPRTVQPIVAIPTELPGRTLKNNSKEKSIGSLFICWISLVTSRRLAYRVKSSPLTSMLARSSERGLCVVHSRFEDRMGASHVSVAASLNIVPTRRVIANSDDFRCAAVLIRKAAYKCTKVVEQQVPF